MVWKIRDLTLTLDRPLLMGILNVTPDSFYDGGKYLNPAQAVDQAARLIQDGAHILDLGAESTRPGAKAVSETEELSRLLPVLAQIKERFQIPISVDTTKSQVAKGALRLGAHIINDVSGLKQDPAIAKVAHEFGAGLVLMHRRGTPENMQLQTDYKDVVGDVIRELSESISIAEASGVSPEQIAIDPGVGFSKTAEQNFEILERLSELARLGRPILIGPSRKSFLHSVTKSAPDRRLFGTTATCALAYERGARIFRVHDVWAIKEALLITEAITHSHSGKKVSI